ncbi:MAG: ATP-binding protein [Planctomycetota bacterium]
MTDELHLTIRNNFAEMERVTRAVLAVIERQALSPKAAYAVELAVEEIITNVMKYAYNDTAPHDIDIRIRFESTHVHLHFEDDGREFDPVAAPEPDTTKPIEERKIGGMGIHLVRAVASFINYRRANGRNILELSIRRDLT